MNKVVKAVPIQRDVLIETSYDPVTKTGDLGPNVPVIKLAGRRCGKLKVGDKVPMQLRDGDDPPHHDPKATDFVGKAIGKRELAYHLGWWTKGMAAKGKSSRANATKPVLDEPTKWQKHDLVLGFEDPEVAGGEKV